MVRLIQPLSKPSFRSHKFTNGRIWTFKPGFGSAKNPDPSGSETLHISEDLDLNFFYFFLKFDETCPMFRYEHETETLRQQLQQREQERERNRNLMQQREEVRHLAILMWGRWRFRNFDLFRIRQAPNHFAGSDPDPPVLMIRNDLFRIQL